MNDDKTKFSVILNIPSGTIYSEFIELFCCKLTSNNGDGYIYHFLCSEVNATHPVYLEMVVNKPSSSHTDSWSSYNIRIPHSLVLMISDPFLEEKQIGFH